MYMYLLKCTALNWHWLVSQADTVRDLCLGWVSDNDRGEGGQVRNIKLGDEQWSYVMNTVIVTVWVF